MKVLFINNIPSPYRVDFLNELGKYCSLTAAFGRESAGDRDRLWRNRRFENFEAVFLRGVNVGTDASVSLQVIAVINRGFDVIILGGYSSPMYVIAMEYMRLHGIPFLLNADGGFVKEDRRAVLWLKRRMIGGASAWLSTGRKTDAYLEHDGARKERIFHYPFTSVWAGEGGIASEAEKREKKDALAVKEERMILTVGQFIPRKGLDLLIRCAAALDERTGIYLVGGTPEEEHRKLAAETKGARVHFVGFKTRKELADYYRAADIFAFPTREDIWGLVLNEAMAYGLPCVASVRSIAADEMVEEGKSGYLVDPEDTDCMAERLNQLLEDSETRRQMGEAAYRKSREYTLEAMAVRHMEIFREFRRMAE